MPKLIVTFNPDNNWNVYCDNMAETIAMQTVVLFYNKYAPNKENYNITFGNETIMLAFRVLIKEKAVKSTDITLLYKDKLLVHTPNGEVHNWPKDSSDTARDLLVRLINK